MVFAVDPRRLWLSCLYLVREGDHVRCWFMCKAIKKNTQKKSTTFKMLQLQWFSYNEALGTFPSGYLCLTFLFIDDCCFFVLWRWQVESTVRVLFKHVSYTELKSVIWNKLWCSLLCSKGQSFFQKKKKKKKDMKTKCGVQWIFNNVQFWWLEICFFIFLGPVHHL